MYAHENLMLWSRYLYRASKLQVIANEEMSMGKRVDGIFPNEMLLLFLTHTYITVEAFRKYAFRDNRIHYMIGRRYKHHLVLLRDLRNSVCHPDESVFSPRQAKLLNESESLLPWVWTLMDEFERFLFFYPESLDIQGDMAIVMRGQLRTFNAWLPDSSLSIVKYHSAQEIDLYRLFVVQNFPEKWQEFSDICSCYNHMLARLPDSFFPELF